MISLLFGSARFYHPTIKLGELSSGSSGRVRGGEKHEIYAAAFGGHLFYDLFSQGRGVMPPRPPWIRYWNFILSTEIYLLILPCWLFVCRSCSIVHPLTWDASSKLHDTPRTIRGLLLRTSPFSCIRDVM